MPFWFTGSLPFRRYLPLVLASLVVCGQAAAQTVDSVFPAPKGDFTASFVLGSTFEGSPSLTKGLSSTKTPQISAKTLDALFVAPGTKFGAGEQLITVSCSGDRTLYASRTGDKVDYATVFSPKATNYYMAKERQGGAMPPLSLTSLSLMPFPAPMLPYRLASTVTPVRARSKRSEMDRLLEVPAGAQLVDVLYADASTTPGKPYYAEGYVSPKGDGWSDYIVGNLAKPSFRLRFGGRKTVGEMAIPGSVVIETNGRGMGEDGVPLTLHKTFRFTLVGAKPQSLPEADFDMEALLPEGAFVHDDKSGTIYKKGAGDIASQLKVEKPPEAPRRNLSGAIMAALFGGLLLVVLLASIWHRLKRAS